MTLPLRLGIGDGPANRSDLILANWSARPSSSKSDDSLTIFIKHIRNRFIKRYTPFFSSSDQAWSKIFAQSISSQRRLDEPQEFSFELAVRDRIIRVT